ncbi:MAG: helix-turn-helix transcriptional regulator [Inquilinus limosus]|uniref:Helix-turn-helix transcriptional regulator n=1 Tax=Inquilinus limosus TaxID=171674 RepID=A0A952FMC5_9PROT|nr:helix-turn-helix transcriptional regulator [Inquilinus limosus]
MERADAILRAVQQIYDSALSPDGWSGALDAVAAVSGGRYAGILIEDQMLRRAQLLTDGTWDPAHLDLVTATAEAGVLPPWIRGVPVGLVTRSSAIQADQDYSRSLYYNEVVRPIGNFYAAVGLLEQTPAHRGLFAIGRPHGAENFADDDVAAMQLLLPHLARVLDLRRRAGEAERRADAIETVLDRVDLGVILVDAEGRPLYFNRPAEALLARADGLSVGRAGIAAALAEDTRRLHRAIAAAAAAGLPGGTIDAAGRAAAAGAHIRVSRPSGRRPLLLTVIPVARARLHAGLAAQVAVFVTDPDGAASPAPALLREMFGLTAAEAALAIEISRGQGLDAAADRLSIAKTTARTHLARIFDKTDTSRQAELVRLLLRCGVSLLPPD